MQSVKVDFGQWLPDQADYENPGLVEANNCYPSPGGFTPFEKPSPTGDTTTEVVVGAQKFFRNDGSSVLVGGSPTRLFTLDSVGITEVSGLNALGPASSWQFERFNDLVIAVSRENVPQYLTDVDTDLTFSALPGNPPRAAVIGKVLDWLVLGDLQDIAGLGSPDVPYRVRWSAFNNPTLDWVTDRGEQSDFRDLDRKYGRVTGIVGGRFGIVFQERAIWRMTYVGAPKVFDFELVSDDRGCIAPGSIVTVGYQTFFLDRSGFFVTNGSDVDGIGDQRLNEFFGESANSSFARMTHGAINWPKRCIVWTYQGQGGMGFDSQLIYSLVIGEWSSASQKVSYLVQAALDAETLGSLGSAFPGGLGTMSAFELGTLEWRGAQEAMGGFVESGNGSEFVTFTGQAAQADFVTGDTSIQAGRRSTVDGVMPLVELQTGSMTTQVRTRPTQGATASNSAATAPGVDGYCPHHVDGWFHSVRTTIAEKSAWDKAKGLWVRVKGTGRR